MADTVSVGGKRVSKWAVYGGIGVVVVGGVLWFRSRSAAASSATSAADPGSQVDPATGLTFAQEAAGVYGGGGSGVGYGYPTPATTTGIAGTGTPGAYASNAQWAQAAEQGLTALGWDAQAVGAAIGKYLAGLALAGDQVTIVQTAVAEYGPPPVGTFAIITAAPAGGTTQPVAPKSAPGLSVTPYKGYANFGWHAVTGATSYELVVTGAGGHGTGTSHFDQSVEGLNVEHLTLAPGAYHAQVRARNTAGAGPWSGTKTFTVTK